jgi:hypothetical protein
VSLLTRKHPVDNMVDARDRAVQTVQRAVPVVQNAIPKAKQAVPLAKNAGNAVLRSAEDAAAWAKPHVDDAAAWAKPHVDDARSWAAPRLERSGIAVQESIAPAISEAMVSAARRLEVPPARKRRRWVSALAVTMMIAAVASAAAAVAMRRRPPAFDPSGIDSDDMTAPSGMPAGQQLSDADDSPLDVEVNGRPAES